MCWMLLMAVLAGRLMKHIGTELVQGFSAHFERKRQTILAEKHTHEE